jgi:hypothetical protein
MSRVLGLSRNQKPKTLLSTFSGNKRKLEKEVEDDAPPLSSEDEDEEPPSVADLKLKPSGPKGTLPDSDDSEAERPARGDIKRSNFSASSTSKSQKSTTRKKGKRESKPSTAEDSDRESSPSSKKRKTTSESENAKPNQFVDERGFTKSRYDKFGGFKYGKAAQASRGSQVSRSSQGSETKQGLLSYHLLGLLLTCLQAKEVDRIARRWTRDTRMTTFSTALRSRLNQSLSLSQENRSALKSQVLKRACWLYLRMTLVVLRR